MDMLATLRATYADSSASNHALLTRAVADGLVTVSEAAAAIAALTPASAPVASPALATRVWRTVNGKRMFVPVQPTAQRPLASVTVSPERSLTLPDYTARITSPLLHTPEPGMDYRGASALPSTWVPGGWRQEMELSDPTQTFTTAGRRGVDPKVNGSDVHPLR